jgi:hypothetical protein
LASEAKREGLAKVLCSPGRYMRRVSMTNAKRNTRSKLPSLAPARAAAPRPCVLLAALAGEKTMDLARLTRAISADRDLCRKLIEAACQELDCPRLRLEQAIVLLGRDRLASHLLSPLRPRRKPVASAWRRPYRLFGEVE